VLRGLFFWSYALALDEDSTLDDAVRQYKNSLRYRAENSIAKANDFIEACMFLLECNPTEVAHGSGRVRIEPGALQSLLNKAEAWIEANDSTSVAGPRGYVRYANFRNFRT
jgi:hypothetical protein